MRKSLTVLIVALLGVFAVKSIIGPGKMNLGESVKYPVPTYDLHVAQPVDMKNFPSDVIPLPGGACVPLAPRWRGFLPQIITAESCRAACPVDAGRAPGILLGFEPQPIGDPAAFAQSHRDVGRVCFRGHGEAGAHAPLVGVDENLATAMPHFAHQ